MLEERNNYALRFLAVEPEVTFRRLRLNAEVEKIILKNDTALSDGDRRLETARKAHEFLTQLLSTKQNP